MKIKIETIPNERIAFVRQIGPYGPDNVQAMEKIKKWAKEKQLFSEKVVIMGIPQDNPETTRPEDCRYDACLVISQEETVDENVADGRLAGGAYAICEIPHTADAIQQAWTTIFKEIQTGAYQVDDSRPAMERYTADMIQRHACELCIPLTALS